MRVQVTILIVLVGAIFSACTSSWRDASLPLTQNRNFSIQSFENFNILQIRDPWQNALNAEFTYVLSDNKDYLPDSLLNYKFIKTPVKSVIAFSTTHIGYLSAIDEEKSLIGASGASYIYNQDIKLKYDKGEIKEIGFPPSINYESIIELNPEVIFIYGLESSVTGIISRLESVGIPCVIIGDYLENHPLGKAEWIKVFSAFYNKEKMADSIYSQIETQYNELCDLVKDYNEAKPTVMLGLPWKGSWSMAGGKSYAAKLIEDAGGDYLWSETDKEDYLPLSVESVIQKALNANFWLNTGSARSINDVLSRDKRYGVFDAITNQTLYNNDNRFDGNSNDYWESGVLEPHVILKDLIRIFHPEVLPDHEFVYYRRLM